MSQAKVDRYKEEKSNRKKTMQKAKAMHALYSVIGTLVCLVLVCWIAYSAYGYFHKEDGQTTASRTEVNVDALNDYLGTLPTADSAE